MSDLAFILLLWSIVGGVLVLPFLLVANPLAALVILGLYLTAGVYVFAAIDAALKGAVLKWFDAAPLRFLPACIIVIWPLSATIMLASIWWWKRKAG